MSKGTRRATIKKSFGQWYVCRGQKETKATSYDAAQTMLLKAGMRMVKSEAAQGGVELWETPTFNTRTHLDIQREAHAQKILNEKSDMLAIMITMKYPLAALVDQDRAVTLARGNLLALQWTANELPAMWRRLNCTRAVTHIGGLCPDCQSDLGFLGR